MQPRRACTVPGYPVPEDPFHRGAIRGILINFAV